MSHLNANQVRELLADDSDLIDQLEIRESDEEDEEEEGADQEDDLNEAQQIIPTHASNDLLTRSLTVEMISVFEAVLGPNVILGRLNKKKTNVLLTWFSQPNKQYQDAAQFGARVFPQILNEKKFKISSS